MNVNEHLLLILSEECNEVGQRASKALRFGVNEVQEGNIRTNAQRIRFEFADLLGVYEMLVEKGILQQPTREMIEAKKGKVLQYLEYSRDHCGTLT